MRDPTTLIVKNKEGRAESIKDECLDLLRKFGQWILGTSTIWLLHTRNNSQLFLSSSSDDGKSWSEPIDVSLSLKHNASTGAGTGHAAGIQLSHKL